jgi:MoxR-like ATPase
MAKIVFRGGEFDGHEVALPEAGITVGRSPKCNLTLADRRISGEHFALRRENDVWWMYDLNSSNGTRVNENRVQAVELKDGDVIGAGDIDLVFVAVGTAVAKNGPSLNGEANAVEGGHSGHTVATGTGSSAASPLTTSAPAVGKRPASEIGVGEDDVALIAELTKAYQQMCEQLSQVIIGQSQVVEEVMIAVFSRGHALLVGVPGLAKTLLISTLSHVLDLSFKRIQFTPDLMPSDITGTDVLEEDRSTGKRAFRFVQGPVFANMVLADEINRTPPKTQAALLEAMQEHRVTVGAQSFELPAPFFVLATQNPIEQEGTYPLPEAQLDRFMFNIVVNYPTAEEESAIIRQVTGAQKSDLQVVLDAQAVLRLQQVVRRVPVADHVIEYARDLARASRPKEAEAPAFVKEMVAWGAGPRAGINLVTAAKARAILHGRLHATTADVTAVALPVLRHRVITTFNAEAAGVTSDEIVRMLIKSLKPHEDLDI